MRLPTSRSLPGCVVIAATTIFITGCASDSASPAGASVEAPAAAVPAGPAWDVVVLLRHAEKQAGGRDPALTDAGRARAVAVAQMLEGSGVTAVFTTPYVRTRTTAGPIAAAVGIDASEYDPRDLSGFAATVHATPGRHVIVGHSNTTPMMVELLGGDPGDPIDDATEFDRLYILTAGADGVTTVVLSSGD